ncbi:MAG: hypothetical protein JRD89_12540 [Deltaproteobacteria bacterium]|nr:hypothetical protein [Deltaproteobacteria bacterium]
MLGEDRDIKDLRAHNERRKTVEIKPLTEDFTARIFVVNGRHMVFEKTEDGVYEYVGVLEPD